MDTRIIFLIVAIVTLGLGIDAGDGIHQNFTEQMQATGKSDWRMLSILTVIMTALGYVLYFAGEENSWSDPIDRFFFQLGPVLAAFGGGATYAMFTGPLWQTGTEHHVWFSGWLILVIIGVMPILLTINQLFLDAASAEARRPK